MHDANRTRTFSWTDAAALRDTIRRLPGLEALQGVVEGRVPTPPMGRLMGLMLVEVARGRAVFEAEPAEYHYNPSAVVHGGFAATILDSAMGCAVHTLGEAGDTYTTLELKVNFIGALRTTTGKVRATGTVVHAGRTTAVAEGRLEGPDGRLYAHGTCTCLLVRDGTVNS
jgi:uncharacterized protein (TIGR00369 family)